MHQDSYFSQNSLGDSSDTPQLPFPEPAGALQLPFPAQQPFDSRQPTMQVPFPQPLPSTDTIDTAEIRFLQLLPMTVADETDEHAQVSPGAPSSLSTETGEIDQVPQLPFPQELAMSGTNFNIQDPAQQIPFPNVTMQPTRHYSSPSSFIAASDQAALKMPMPGLIEVPLVSKAMAVQEDSQPTELAPSNQEAKRAIINGVIAFLVSLLTLSTVAGFAGLVIGAFAMLYGFLGLRLARHLPDKAGRGQALVGIALGFTACCIVIGASILRAPHSS